MIGGEAVVATVALCTASAGFVAAGVAPHLPRRRRRSTDVGGEVRPILRESAAPAALPNLKASA